MPNWCSNRFVIHGEKGLLLKFYMDMSAAISEHPNFPRVENDWNRDWIGNLFLEAGYPQNVVEYGNQIQCRGSVTGLEFEKDHVVLDMETAWSPNDESMQMMLDEKYPGLQMVFMAEEPGCEIFINTDEEGRWLPDRFMIDCYGFPKMNDECEYFRDEDDLVAEVARLTGLTPAVIRKDMGQAHAGNFDWDQWAKLKYNMSDEDDCYFGVHEFTLG